MGKVDDDFKIYDNCKHFIIRCGDDYDCYEGSHDFSYGCIKCGLNNHDERMQIIHEVYFKTGHHLRGYLSLLEFSFAEDGSLELGYERAKHLFNKIAIIDPYISNKDLEELLKKELDRIWKEEVGRPRERI